MYGKSNMEAYITICTIDNQQEFALWLRKLKQGLYINLGRGIGKEMGGRFNREGIYVHLWLIDVKVWQKTAKFCKAIILQLKNSNQLTCVCCCSVAQSCLTLCDPMDCSTPDFPVFHYFEFAQTHAHWVDDTIQPSHPLSSPFPPAFNLSQHQGLFQWVSSLHQVTKVLEFQLPASVLPMNIQGWLPLGLIGLISLQSKILSRVFSNTTIQKHQFFSTQPSLWSNSHIHTWLLEKTE